MKTNYGIISDVHQDPRIVELAINILKNQGAEKLILNGDIGNSQQFVGYVLNCAGESGIETYVQPGSHERLEDFEPVIKYFQGKYPNLINVFDNRKVSNNCHDLIFMPGSDFLCGGEYILQNSEDNISGFYKTDNGFIRLTNMSDLTNLVTNPDKTIVVCHIPKRFNNLQYGIDVAEFGEVEEDFILDREKVEKGSVYSEHVAVQIVNAGFPVKLKKENRGSQDLKDIYEKLGIKKSISGHFHESGHKACDMNGNPVKDNELTDELFWNASYCDAGKVGILSIDGNSNKASYRNINLQDFLR